MSIIPWKRREAMTPFRTDFEELWNRFFDTNGGSFASRLPEAFQRSSFPAMNVAETEDRFCVTLDAPGLEEKDFHVEVMGNQLLISGERKWEEEKKDKEFHSVESQFGRFERSFTLPDGVDRDNVMATYKKGVLTIEIGKKEKTPAAKIPVKAG